MPSLPGVRLTRASDYGPSRSSWLVTLPKEGDKVAGMVVRDTDVLMPGHTDSWQAFMRGEEGPRAHQHLSWHRTRAMAEHAVLVEYAKRKAEVEAYEVRDAFVHVLDEAEAHAREQRIKDDTQPLVSRQFTHVVFDESEDMLKDLHLYGLTSVRNRLAGRAPLDLTQLESEAYTTRMVQLEIERRQRQEKASPDPYAAHILRSQRVVEEADANSYVKPEDSLLVTELGEALVSPWKLTPPAMTMLLDTVRELEKLALGTVKHRPVSMVVEIQDSVLKPLADRIEVLEERMAALEDEDSPLVGIVDEIAGQLEWEDLPLATTITTCGCPDSDDEVHEPDCVNNPDHPKYPLSSFTVQETWRDSPYSLPPAVREGVECPACRDAGKRAMGLTATVIVNHENQEDVDECVRRQKTLGWIDPTGRSDLLG